MNSVVVRGGRSGESGEGSLRPKLSFMWLRNVYG